MSIRSGKETFCSLLPLMQKYGAVGDPKAFFEAVNEAFHDQEALVYDQIHKDMWLSLPEQFRILSSDVPAEFHSGKESVLDVGCGTGLAFHLFQDTSLGRGATTVQLLDTSPKMLSAAMERAQTWSGIKTDSFLGTLADLQGRELYDVAIACSVLHHIPDLPEFLSHLDRVLKPGALFLHLQDQNDDADQHILAKRLSRVPRQRPAARARLTSALERAGLLNAIREVRNLLVGPPAQTGDYIETTNDILMARKVIKRRMSAEDVWRVTDIHIGTGVGLSVKELTRILRGFQLVSVRTYSFFGQTASLPYALELEERRLVKEHDLNVSLVAAVWRKITV